MVPVVLVVSIVVILTVWQLRREYSLKRNLKPDSKSVFNLLNALLVHRNEAEKGQPEHVSADVLTVLMWRIKWLHGLCWTEQCFSCL